MRLNEPGDGRLERAANGVSIKGATIIYAPAGQAGEYAPLATNPYRGCGHKCAYCYVPGILRMERAEFDRGATLRPDYLAKLEKDARKYQAAGVTEQVLLCFTTDPYHPGDTAPTRRTLEILSAHGLAFCTLRKGGSRALRDIDLFRADRDAFASTLTSVDAVFSRKWERAAADQDERILTLRAFHERGVFTWILLEPTIDAESSLAVIDATHEFVDLYKVGKLNYLPQVARTVDWRDCTLRMIDRLSAFGKAHYVKRDLQSYLPEGYPNPLRAPQRHILNAAAGRFGNEVATPAGERRSA
jgi:hypothetical protein